MLRLAAADVDLDTGTVTRGDRILTLLPSEAALLRYLAANPERTLSRAELLTEVWGYAPGARTRTVDTAVKTLRSKVEADPARPVHVRTVHGQGYCFVATALSATEGGRMPASADRFFGRADELAVLAAALRGPDRALVLVGPGGIGKTRLALEAARAHGRGWFCDLTGAVTAEELRSAVAGALDVALPARGDRGAVLGRALAARGEALLVLDNAEGLDEEAAVACGALVEAAARARILVTSRRPLRIRGERRIEVTALPMTDAVALLVDRAGRVRPGFGSAGEQPWVEAIATALDGIPLALELAAARAGVLGARELAGRITGSLQWLDRGSVDAPDRHRTLSAAIRWTWDQLDADQRAALSQCAAFAGPFRAVDAEEVLRGCGRPLDRVQELREWSLLAERTAGDGEVALRLLEAVRAFVAEEAPPDRDVVDRHARWAVLRGEKLTRAADERDPALPPPAALRALADLHADLRRVVDGLDPERVVRAAMVLDRVLVHQGRFPERLALHDRAVAVADTPELRAHAYRYRADARVDAGVEGADEDLDQSVAASQAAADPALDARVLATLCAMRVQQARFSEALPVAHQAMAAARAVGDRVAEADTLANLGLVLEGTGRGGEALEVYERALAAHRAVGNATNAGKVLGFLGGLHLERGEVDRAERCFARALASHQEVGYEPGVLRMSGNLALVAGNRGDFARAAAGYREVLVGALRSGDRIVERIARTYLARMALYLGRVDEALEEAALAVEGYRDPGSPVFEALALAALGAAERAAGRHDAAERTLVRAIERCPDPRIGAHLRLERATTRIEAGDRDGALADVAEAAAVLEPANDPPGVQLLALVRALAATDADVASALRASVGEPTSDHVHWLAAQYDRRAR